MGLKRRLTRTGGVGGKTEREKAARQAKALQKKLARISRKRNKK